MHENNNFHDDVISLVKNPADRLWLEGLPKEWRASGVAFVRFKATLGGDADKLSKPWLFMQGFELGMQAQRELQQIAILQMTKLSDTKKAENLRVMESVAAEPLE